MLKIPIDLHKNVLILLKVKHYPTLFEHLDYYSRKSICQYILNNALDNETIISTPDEVEGLLTLISSVITESNDIPQDYEEDTEDLIDEQTLVSRLIHLMKSDNLDEQFMVKKF
jgi:vacuolar protein sorting-associated protein 35